MQPMPEPIDIPIKPGVFVDDDFAPERARLRGTRCGRCGETFFPPRQVCPRCHVAGTMEDVTCGRVGRINSITRVVRTPHHYTQAYWLAEVDLAEGVRLLAQVDAPLERPLPIGATVELTTRPILLLPDGKRVWGYVFTPVDVTS
jgi:uncharacterized protein